MNGKKQTCALAKCPQDNQIVVFLDPFQLGRHVAELYVGLVENNQNWKCQYSKDLQDGGFEWQIMRWIIILIQFS